MVGESKLINDIKENMVSFQKLYNISVSSTKNLFCGIKISLCFLLAYAKNKMTFLNRLLSPFVSIITSSLQTTSLSCKQAHYIVFRKIILKIG